MKMISAVLFGGMFAVDARFGRPERRRPAGHKEMRPVRLDRSAPATHPKSDETYVLDASPEAQRIERLERAFQKLRPLLRQVPVYWERCGGYWRIADELSAKKRWAAGACSEDLPPWELIQVASVTDAAEHAAVCFDLGLSRSDPDNVAIMVSQDDRLLPPSFRQFLDIHGVDRPA